MIQINIISWNESCNTPLLDLLFTFVITFPTFPEKLKVNNECIFPLVRVRPRFVTNFCTTICLVSSSYVKVSRIPNCSTDNGPPPPCAAPCRPPWHLSVIPIMFVITKERTHWSLAHNGRRTGNTSLKIRSQHHRAINSKKDMTCYYS